MVLCGDEWLPWASQALLRDLSGSGVIERVSAPPEPPAEWLATFAVVQHGRPGRRAPVRRRHRVGLPRPQPDPHRHARAGHGAGAGRRAPELPGARVPQLPDDRRGHPRRQPVRDLPLPLRAARERQRRRRPSRSPSPATCGPAKVQIRLKIEDVFGQQFAVASETLDVPSLGRGGVPAEDDPRDLPRAGRGPTRRRRAANACCAWCRRGTSACGSAWSASPPTRSATSTPSPSRSTAARSCASAGRRSASS